MREIKFRAWDGIRMTTTGIQFNNTTGELLFIPKGTLMQYTGLRDRNGVEIFEGDIVKVIYEEVRDRSNTDDPDDWCEENASIHEVNWCGDYPAFDIKPFPQYWESNGLQHAIIEHTIEVIGNVWENPELLPR